MIVEDFPPKSRSNSNPMNTLSHKDVIEIIIHENDLMLIMIQLSDWEIKQVSRDPRSSAKVLYLDAFEGKKLDPNYLQSFRGSLVCLSKDPVQVKGYITLKTMFELKLNINIIKVRYIVIDAPLSYTIIIIRPTFNLLEPSLLTLHLRIKYSLKNRYIGIIQWD